LKPRAVAYLLGKLLVHDGERARTLAESYIQFSASPTDEDLSRAVAAGRALILNTRDGDWSVLWHVIQHNNDFGRRLVEDVAYHAGQRAGGVTPPDLSENELANLYIWLTRNYPHAEDPRYRTGFGSYTMTPRRLVASWRDSTLSRLEELGTTKSCEEIRRLAREFPELVWLKWVLRRAQETARRNTWEAPKPSEIMQLARDSRSGLVQSGEQLLRAVIESVKQLEIRLQAGAAAHELWNEDPICKPKDENRLAQKVEAHLNETLTPRGVVANREVVVRRGRTDIHVDAVKKSAHGDVHDRITVIIEVKGCWHRDLKKAMNTQLLGQYLADSRSDYGLYLVGWFLCDQWALEFRGRTPNWNLHEAQAFFDAQAKQCSKDGKVIKAFVLNASL
jgi:hypothetical protein